MSKNETEHRAAGHSCLPHGRRAMTGHTIYRTAAPAWLRLARHRVAAEAGFIALILAAGFALDRLAGVILTVLEKFA